MFNLLHLGSVVKVDSVTKRFAGHTAVETGRALGISAHTVSRHLSNMASKVGVRGRIALTRYAVEHHIVYDEL